MKGHYKYVDMARNAFDQLKKAKATTELVDKMFVNLPDSTKKEMSAASKEVRDSINKMMLIFLPSQKPSKGINRTDETLQTYLYRANSYLMSSDGKPSQMAKIALEKAKNETLNTVEKVNQFIQKQWDDYQKQIESVQFSIFKEINPIRSE